MAVEEIKKITNKLAVSIGLSLALVTGNVEAKTIQVPEQYEIPMQENLKQRKIKEYKELIMKDRVLSKIFTKEEIDERLSQSISEINIVDRIGNDDAIRANYNIANRKIKIAQDAYNDYLEDKMFHELTHALFTNSEKSSTGFFVLNIARTENGIGVRTFGRALNEGATEYTMQKLLANTDYGIEESYEFNKRVFEYLCIIYGEEFMFKALKTGPEMLAERLEQDGVSFMELASLLDQPVQSIEQKKHIGMRAKRLVTNLLVEKYSKANEKQKLEYVNRARQISVEQEREKDRINKYYLSGRVRFQIEPMKFIAMEGANISKGLNQDIYNRYINSNKFDSKSDVDDILAVQSVVNTAILGTHSIAIEDVKQIQLKKLQKENSIIYTFKLRERNLGLVYVGVDRNGNKIAVGLPPQKISKKELNQLPTSGEFRVGDILKSNRKEYGYDR